MESFLPGLIIGFREGLEAFLIIAIILRYLDKLSAHVFKKYVWKGVAIGITISLLVGFGLFKLSAIVGNASISAKTWESIASICAVLLITPFIFWMMKNAKSMKKYVKKKLDSKLSRIGVITLAATIVAREGVEIALFLFTGKFMIQSTILGVGIALILAILIFHSLVKVNLKLIFNITLAYLIIQAGFLLGYSIHEGLSALKESGQLDANSILLSKAFNLSDTILNHKEGALGVPLYISLGWYSKPEWIQFLIQYTYTLTLFYIWRKKMS